ncbi:MAG: FecR family protein [Burkholderiales bacterium]
MFASIARFVPAILLLAASSLATAADIGQVKTSKGDVSIERGGTTLPGTIGTRLEAADVIRTGPDGSAGITMSDNSLLSVGPNSVLALDTYRFDTTTHQGQFDATLSKGSLAVVSGKIAKQAPDAMKVRTPASVLGVRGTEFVVAVGG